MVHAPSLGAHHMAIALERSHPISAAKNEIAGRGPGDNRRI
jgi:hypothetical protein